MFCSNTKWLELVASSLNCSRVHKKKISVLQVLGWKTFAFFPSRFCSRQLKQWLENEQLPEQSLSHFTSRVEVEFESLPVWLKHSKAEHGFSKRFSNSLFLSPSVFQNSIASATFRSFKDTFIYVHFNLTLGFKLVTEQSTESMMLLVMSLHARGSQSIFLICRLIFRLLSLKISLKLQLGK